MAKKDKYNYPSPAAAGLGLAVTGAAASMIPTAAPLAGPLGTMTGLFGGVNLTDEEMNIKKKFDEAINKTWDQIYVDYKLTVACFSTLRQEVIGENTSIDEFVDNTQRKQLKESYALVTQTILEKYKGGLERKSKKTWDDEYIKNASKDIASRLVSTLQNLFSEDDLLKILKAMSSRKRTEEPLSNDNGNVSSRKIEYRKNYTERIIAFVDILGFKNIVEESVTNKYEYQKILDSLNRFRRLKKEEEEQGFINGAKVTTFSDSLVISYPVDNRDVEVFYNILLELIHLQLDLLEENVIIRGGIAIGKLRHTRDEIFGPAMNMAYYLESKVAKYPRIIIGKDTLAEYFDVVRNNETYIERLRTIIRKDSNEDFYYLDYLNADELFSTKKEYSLMLKMIESIIKHGKQLRDNKTLDKYVWLENYYNSVKSESKKEMQIDEASVKNADALPSSRNRKRIQSNGKDLDNIERHTNVHPVDETSTYTLEKYYKEYNKDLIENYKKDLIIFEANAGKDILSVGKKYRDFAEILQKIGVLSEAGEYYRKARKIFNRVEGPYHLETVDLYNKLGAVYRDMGKYDEALKTYKKALHIRTKMLGPNDTTTLETKRNIEYVRKKIDEDTYGWLIDR